MNNKNSDPPKAALWLLQHARPGGDNDAFTGDLVERFREGQTEGWFWKETFFALAVRLLGAILRHWPYFAYALAGTALQTLYLSHALEELPRWLHWQTLPWPWSQIALELSRTIACALAALPFLAVGLAIDRSFRWSYLLRTATICMAVILIVHFVPYYCPWLFQPLPGNSNLRRPIIPFFFPVWLAATDGPKDGTEVFQCLYFLISAWLGCLPLRHDTSTGRPVTQNV
jgi:hypothetical protein